MKVIVTGISGSGRSSYLQSVLQYATGKGKQVKILEVGNMMFAIAQALGITIPEDKILDLSPSTLGYLRTAVFEQILRECSQNENLIISTHACFRWKKHILNAFDFHYLNEINPDLYVTVVDELLPIKARLEASDQWKDHLDLKDILIWRDEEIFITKAIADFQRKPFYIMPRKQPPDTLYRFMLDPNSKKVYLSYPITHVRKHAEKLRAKDGFRDKLRTAGMVIFDPGEIDDVNAIKLASDAASNKKERLEFETEGNRIQVPTREIQEMRDYIYDQIVARDYQLIDQSDLIIVYYYIPVMSPGVLSEMSYGFTNNRDVLVVFKGPESPFFHYYSTRIFSDESELMQYLKEIGFVRQGSG